MKNAYEIRGDVTAIFINSPKYGVLETLISTSKIKLADSFPLTWFVSRSRKENIFYVVGSCDDESGKRITVCLHRLVMGADKTELIDHIDHDTMNNTDSNLRGVSHSENSQNRTSAAANSKSGVRGVHWCKRDKRYIAKVSIKGKTMFSGYYKNFDDAAKSVAEARKKFMPFCNDL